MSFTQSAIVTAPPVYSGPAWARVRILERQAGVMVVIDEQSLGAPLPGSTSDFAVTTHLATLATSDYSFILLASDGSMSPTLGPITLPVVALPGWFTLAELRGSDQDLADLTRFPDDKLTGIAQDAIEALEDACDLAFTPRTTTVLASGTRGDVLTLPLNDVSAALAVTPLAPVGASVTLAAVRAIGTGLLLTGGWPVGVRNLSVTVTYGMPAPPRRVRRAAMTLARVWALKGPVSDRATSTQGPNGETVTLQTPGQRGSYFGVPEVDQVVSQYGARENVLT